RPVWPWIDTGCSAMVLGAADQHIGAEAGANGGFRGGAGVAAGERRDAAGGRRIDRPHHLTAGGGAEVEAELADHPDIDFAGSRLRRREQALQLLLRRDEQAEAAGNIAGERADLGALRPLRGAAADQRQRNGRRQDGSKHRSLRNERIAKSRVVNRGLGGLRGNSWALGSNDGTVKRP